MILHTTPSLIAKSFERLLRSYKSYSFATAWASVKFDAADLFLKNLNRCEIAVIGTHFYQTHPEFIERTMHHTGVRFVINSNGVFHPKIFLFFNSDTDWVVLIGSANFTKAAFTINQEAIIEISSNDQEGNQIYKQAKDFIKRAWEEAETLDREKLEEYRESWHKKKAVRKQLENRDNKQQENDTTSFQNLSWSDYVKNLSQTGERLRQRMAVLKEANRLLSSVDDFSQLQDYEKLFIAGISGSGYDAPIGHYELFGTTHRVHNFSRNIKRTNSPIVRAINAIPLKEDVTQKHYKEFLKEFNKAYKSTCITAGSRLLALKRPDVFYCYTSANRTEFGKKFKISPTTVNLNNYWERVVEKIAESNWYNTASPISPYEGEIAFGRAALLDALFY